jgi:protein arginine kinase activator
MLCQICGKNAASVHFTEINDNKMSELHVCERCAEEKGMQGPTKKQKFDIADLLAGMVDGMTSTEEERVGHVQCPRCGMQYSAFKEDRPARVARSAIRRSSSSSGRCCAGIHGDTHHKGKVPTRDGEGATRSRQIQRLHDELQRAVEREDFERAAGIRDEVKRLEHEAQEARQAPSPRKKKES